MKITLFIALILCTIASFGQGYKDTRLIAKDSLKLLNGGKFMVSDTIIPITRASYIEYSTDGVTWAKDYAGTPDNQGYIRVSNDARQNWNTFFIYNLTNVLWSKPHADTIQSATGNVNVRQNLIVDGQYFKGGDTLKVTDLSASDGDEAYFLSIVGGKAKWVASPTGAGIYSAINVGLGGVPIYHSTDSTIFKFKSIGISNNSIVVTDDVTNKRVDLKVNPTYFSLTPGAGLGGGGTFDASGNVGVNLSIPSLSSKTFDTNSDFVFYDPATATHYKTKIGSDNYGYWRFNVNNGLAYTVNSHDTLKVYGQNGLLVSRTDNEIYFKADTSILATQFKLDTLSSSISVVGRSGSYNDLLNKPAADTLFTTISASDETTNLAVATGVRTFRMPVHATLVGVRASVNTAPVGSTIIVDINEAGASVLGTKLSIDASEKTSVTAASQATITDSDIADDAEMTIDIDQVGSSTAGKGLKVIIYYTKQ